MFFSGNSLPWLSWIGPLHGLLLFAYVLLLYHISYYFYIYII